MTPSAWRDGGRGETIRWTNFDSPLGQMLIAATAKGICRLTFDDSRGTRCGGCSRMRRSWRTPAGCKQLVEGALAAIERPLAAPELPIDVAGTAFQEAVWRELRKIPVGETRSYAQIAAAIGQPKAVRAVGTANGDNHVAVLIPCHRVIRSDGSLGGYAGGLDRKRKLLAAEGQPVEVAGAAAGRISACRVPSLRLKRRERGLAVEAEWMQTKAAVAADRRFSAGGDAHRGASRHCLASPSRASSLSSCCRPSRGVASADAVRLGRDPDPRSSVYKLVIGGWASIPQTICAIPRALETLGLGLAAASVFLSRWSASRRCSGSIGSQVRATRADLSRALIGSAIFPASFRGTAVSRDPVPLARGVRRQLDGAAADLGAFRRCASR